MLIRFGLMIASGMAGWTVIGCSPMPISQTKRAVPSLRPPDLLFDLRTTATL